MGQTAPDIAAFAAGRDSRRAASATSAVAGGTFVAGRGACC